MKAEITNYLQAHRTAIIVALILIILIYVLQIVARWKLFRKMDESGWKSIIPIYNTIVLYDCIWTTAVFWFSVFISFIGGIAGAVLKLFQTGILSNTGRLMHYIFLGCEYYIMGAGLLIMLLMIIFNIKYAKAFGRSVFFALGLLFIPRLFELILAFGKSKYIY